MRHWRERKKKRDEERQGQRKKGEGEERSHSYGSKGKGLAVKPGTDPCKELPDSICAPQNNVKQTNHQTKLRHKFEVKLTM